MTSGYRRFIAAIGAVFAILATISLTIYFFNMNLWGGAFGIAALLCYIFAFGFFALIKLNDKNTNSDNTQFKFEPDDEPETKDVKEESDKLDDNTQNTDNRQ